MSLRINSNISAQNAHRFLSINDSKMSKAIERLSSGLRINSAADDAAGLVISENLRTNISGLGQAQKNTQDGINLIKTTESALNEIESQLRIMRDLTLHAANANGNVQMLAADQAQMTQAATSIDRIASQTEFAGRKLLSATENVGGLTFQIGANAGQTAAFNLPSGTYDGAILTANMTTTSLQVSAGATTASMARTTAGTAMSNAALGAAETLTITGALGSAAVALPADATTDTMNEIIGIINAQEANTGVKAYLSTADGSISGVGAENVFLSFKSTDGAGVDATGSAQSIAIISNRAAANGTGIGTAALTATGGDATGVLDLTVSTSVNYTTVLSNIDTALKQVNGLRVHLGAYQSNNLESNLNSLAVAKENMSASESAIRDTDMASEMVEFTKSQILTQAAQAMMTQANQAPQGILQMLR